MKFCVKYADVFAAEYRRCTSLFPTFDLGLWTCHLKGAKHKTTYFRGWDVNLNLATVNMQVGIIDKMLSETFYLRICRVTISIESLVVF